MLFHPEIVNSMQRTLGAEALRRLAGPGMDGIDWVLDGDIPDDWRSRVSTYLKAWAMNLDPDALLEMAKLLALAGYKTEGRQAAAIVADWFPSYAPRFFAGQQSPGVVEDIVARAREVVLEISKARLLLHGLNARDSIIAVWKVLFSPTLRKHFGSDRSFAWTEKLITNLAEGNQATFSAQYKSLIPEVEAVMSTRPKYSMSSPPWSMVSIDMRFGLVPWVTPAFDKGFAILLKNGSALEKQFGNVLSFAFFLRGGPGDSKGTAFRVCAPTSPVRASAEHWLMRGYLVRREQGFHATLAPDEAGQRFSLHHYADGDGIEKDVFFETTDSFGREEEDFREFLESES